VDEDVGELIFVAIQQHLRQVVVGVKTGREHHLETALVGDPLAEGGVAGEPHRARLDHRRHTVALDRVRVRDGCVPLGLLVVEVRKLEARRLVGATEVLVDQRQAELVYVDRPVHGLDCGHAGSPPPKAVEGNLTANDPKRGSQDSNLEPPVLETGTLPIELLPLAW
jgi:hypothetical protein